MQTLQELIINKIVFNGTNNYNLHWIPRTLAAVYRNAERSIEEFKILYEAILGAISQEHLRFHPNGDVNVEGTLENLIKFNKPQAFKYCSALNKIEKLPEIWKALTFVQKVELMQWNSFVVGYRASEIVLEEEFRPAFNDKEKFILYCVGFGWEAAFFGLYNALNKREQKMIFFRLWVYAAEDSKIPRKQGFCFGLLRKVLKPGFIFDDQDKNNLLDYLIIKYAAFLPHWEAKNLPEDCENEFCNKTMEELVFNVRQSSSPSSGSQ